MTIYDIYQIIISNSGWGVSIIIILALVISKLIKINPININPINAFSNWLSKEVTKDLSVQIKDMNKKIDDNNADIKKQISNIGDKVDNLENQFQEHKAIESRTRILRFGDEVSHGTNHSREHFQQILNIDITNYNTYCSQHSEFKNDMTRMTVERIKEDYMIRDRDDNFL